MADEHSLQVAVVQHLLLRAPDTVVWYAVPNGSYRSKRTAGRLKAEGVQSGIADICLVIDGCAYGLELKTARGRQSPAQRAMQRRWEAAGGVYVVAKGIDEALATLSGWGAFGRAEQRQAA